MEHLDSASQERWVETVQAIDFTHSSRKAWSVVRRLTVEKNNKPQVPIKANKIAQHVVKNGRKSGKAPGPDSIHPEFLMHLGTECQNWSRMFMTNCMQRTKLPNMWRRAKMIAILKPGKSPEEARSYRPISLLSVCVKRLERLVYKRLLPVVDPKLPREQAGFRPGRSNVEHVVKLTEYIETAFENQKKNAEMYLSTNQPLTT